MTVMHLISFQTLFRLTSKVTNFFDTIRCQNFNRDVIEE